MDCLEIIQAISIIVASLVAIYGIGSWRREVHGKRKIELAEEVLALFYQANDVINYMRFPGSYGYEGESRESSENETKEQKKVRNNAYVLIERYQPEKEIFSELQSLRYRFMAIFGKDSANPFEDLRILKNRLFLSSNRLSRLWSENLESIKSEKERNTIIKSIEKEELYFWDDFSENDVVKPQLQKIIEKIEQICLPILLSKKNK